MLGATRGGTRKRFAAWSDGAGSGAGSQIAGFVIIGEGTKKVVVRGVGPGLAPGVTGYLADPALRLWKLRRPLRARPSSAVDENYGCRPASMLIITSTSLPTMPWP